MVYNQIHSRWYKKLKAENWTQFYSDLECNKEVKQQIAYIMGFTRFQTSCADCISNLANNPDGLSILAVNRFNELFLFHSMQYQNQNIFCPDYRLLGLSGGGAKAYCYHIDHNTLFQDVVVNTPS